jgi:hypothetical protein
LNEFVRSRNGWITSVPGDVEVTIECLPGSSQAQGYALSAAGEGERIVAPQSRAVLQGAEGELEPLTSGSIRAVVQVVTHAGICKVQCYSFGMV